MFFVNSVFSSILGILAVSEIIIITIKLIIALIEIYIIMQVFNKAKQPIWAAIIPIYNKAVLLKIANMSPWWIIISVLSILCNFIELPLLALIVSILELVIFVIIQNINLSKAFDYSISFAIGMMFFPWIFYAIIGFGSSRYIGTKEQKLNAFKLNGNSNKDYVPRSDFFRE